MLSEIRLLLPLHVPRSKFGEQDRIELYSLCKPASPNSLATGLDSARVKYEKRKRGLRKFLTWLGAFVTSDLPDIQVFLLWDNWHSFRSSRSATFTSHYCTVGACLLAKSSPSSSLLTVLKYWAISGPFLCGPHVHEKHSDIFCPDLSWVCRTMPAHSTLWFPRFPKWDLKPGVHRAPLVQCTSVTLRLKSTFFMLEKEEAPHRLPQLPTPYSVRAGMRMHSTQTALSPKRFIPKILSFLHITVPFYILDLNESSKKQGTMFFI